MNIASHGQSIAKAFTWRATAGLDTVLIGYLITGHVGAAVSIAGAELATKSVLYYLHERAWLNGSAALNTFKRVWRKVNPVMNMATLNDINVTPWGEYCPYPMVVGDDHKVRVINPVKP